MTVTDDLRIAPDPRPRIVQDGGRYMLAGGRCTACGHALLRVFARCPRCRGEVVAERFGPDGSVWAVTILHVAPAGREAPYALAYLDLDDGPRVLVHLSEAAPIGTRARLTEPTGAGDPAAEVLA